MREELRRPERQISSFVANEFLLDYVEGKLDKDRRKAIEDALGQNADTKKRHDQLKHAVSFCNKLQKLTPDTEFVQTNFLNRAAWEKALTKMSWRALPDRVRWTTEAFLISCFVAVTVYVTPWSEVAKLQRFVQEKVSTEKSLPALPPLPEVKTETVEAPVVPVVSMAPAVKEAPKIEPTKAPVKVVAAPTAAPTVAVAVAPTAAPTAAPKAVGLLYRIVMKIADIETKAAEITAKIEGLEGTRAGDVPLGWRKPDGNYFHFAIPESKHQALMQTLGRYGSVRMQKTSHPRVMPEGQIRVILWIEDDVIPVEDTTAESGAVEEPSATEVPAEETSTPDSPTSIGEDGE